MVSMIPVSIPDNSSFLSLFQSTLSVSDVSVEKVGPCLFISVPSCCAFYLLKFHKKKSLIYCLLKKKGFCLDPNNRFKEIIIYLHHAFNHSQMHSAVSGGLPSKAVSKCSYHERKSK